MHRRLTSLVKNGGTSRAEDLDIKRDNESTVSTVVRDGDPLPPLSLKVKRVDHYYSKWSKTWKYRVSVSTSPISKH